MSMLRSNESLTNLTDFVMQEAELADTHSYDQWLALWNQTEALYFVPYGDIDEPGLTVAVIRDDYLRMCDRINRLKSGQAHTQEPKSTLSRVLGQPVVRSLDDGRYLVQAKFVCVEIRPDREFLWAGTAKYTLAEVGTDRVELHRKVVHLVNLVRPVPALTFII